MSYELCDALCCAALGKRLCYFALFQLLCWALLLNANDREPMQQTVLTIINPLGLHARAASKFVDCAKHFESTITLATHSGEVDGKSIMKLLLLGAPMGTQITLRVVGVDEDSAFQATCELINAGFGELEE